ncbi:expressed protein [Cryptococcus deneoformans JEC21]|uniref:Expressed protein n=1 Tax=Cryptococcus deneoformans (strain JEC21 / ATCC MYA-565) TaxID=214684 RepID=Q5K747_CRYD1|nr:expressed protein [Cryptococcus neoformans var. neoformans JEC21]AAW47194.1 expressed protein [Cryptococcus neoformans var. neoformans JEC21]
MSAAEMNWVESTEAPARDADFETCWNFIAAGVKRIVVAHNNHFRSISDQYYGLLYNTINNCCTSPPIMEGDGATAQDEEPKRPALLLYERLQYRFSDYCRPIAEELDSLPDDQLFQVYALRWGRYTATATHLDRLFSCFNGNWTRHQHIAKRDSVFTIGMLARVTWKQHVYQHLVERGRDSLIYKALINQIEQYRKGQDVDTVMLEQAIDSHAYFGLIRPRVLGLAPHSPYLVSSGPTVAT